MLYIFHVDTGTTITFDIKLALENVSQLKEAIERECGVVAAQQVLLMSGGESLEPHARVCSYSAGTDTNPIYLFSKAAIESHVPPTLSIDYGSDVDLQNQIEASLVMPATYQTLVNRAQLAQQCCGLAREQTRICERLVHDQHLQQQGWAAVVANLEDITQTFQSRADFLQQSFTMYLSERQQYMDLLQNFNNDLGTLAKIPILPALRAQAEGLFSPDDQPSQTEEESKGSDEVLSLLRWISAKDNQSSLEQVAEQCSRGLEQFDDRVIEALKAEVTAAIENASKPGMKEIKGLGERLFALEQLMAQAKKLVHEQGELAQGFLQNQRRADNLGDPSILPDLCASHRRQLLVMLQNHNQLRDIRRRCTKAKEELSVNIYHRLKWIMYVENKINEVDGKFVMYHESLKRLRRHLEVLQQIHLAPQMYMNAVAEVVRRRTFSHAFLVWASNLACQLLTVHSEELERRREFQSKFEGHFLNTLFPGLEDTPPPFATQAPSVFDNGLPKLTAADMQSLRSQLPDLALTVSAPDLNSITQFFLSKSLTEGSTDGNKEKDSTSMRVDVPAKEQEQARAPMLTDRGGFESETDTEEFEKIGQEAADSKPGSFDSAKQIRQKQLEENLGNTREEVERLRSILKTMKAVVQEALTSLRGELTVLRDQSNTDKTGLSEMTERIQQALSLYSRECDRRICEREQELTVDHELEMADVKRLMQNRDEEICSLKRNLVEKEKEVADFERLLSIILPVLQMCVEQQLDDALEQAQIYEGADAEKTKDEKYLAIVSLTKVLTNCHEQIQVLKENFTRAGNDPEEMDKETTEKLEAQYKSVLDKRRQFLASHISLERSPSDSSLEKIEEKDIKLEASVAIRTAIEKKRADCIAKLNHELHLARQKIEEKDKQIKIHEVQESALDHELHLARQKIKEKDKQIEIHEVQESALAEKCRRYKNAVRQLVETGNLENYMCFKDSGMMKYLGIDPQNLDGSEEVEVSESKKVRLEEMDDHTRLYKRLEVLENDNKRLNAELQVIRESKESAEARMEVLKADNIRLGVELVKERSRRNFSAGGESSSSSEDLEKEVSTSAAVLSESALSRGATVSSDPNQRSSFTEGSSRCSQSCKRVKSMSNLFRHGTFTTTSCNPGDIVLVLWNSKHENYTLCQESPTWYFVNADCIAALGLGINPDGTPKPFGEHVYAEVVEKEYCHARKSENRYHVPLGTKFYRVRVKPVSRRAVLLTKNRQQ